MNRSRRQRANLMVNLLPRLGYRGRYPARIFYCTLVMARNSNGKLHVFAGLFKSREDACKYTEEQWEPEPDETASDEEYTAWEERNPIWGLADDLGVGLDSDFIETIDGNNRYRYLRGYLRDAADLSAIEKMAKDSNILVLIFPDAIHDRRDKFDSTSKLIYCGEFDFTWS